MDQRTPYPQDYCVNLKKHLQKYLSDNDMTAAQLARKSGVSKQVLSTWLNGANPRNIQQVKSVADTIGMTVDQLCFDTANTSTQTQKYEITDEWISGIFELKIRRLK